MSKNLQPELRFKGFNSNWENEPFLSLIDKIVDFRGRTPKKMGLEWSNEGYLALSALNVKHGYIDFKVSANYGDDDLYQKWMAGNELRKGQVLFTTEAPMGNVAQVPDAKGYILSQRTIAFNPDYKKVIDNYLAVLLGTDKVFNKLNALSSGGTAKGVSQKSLENLTVDFSSSLVEQQQIGDFFQSIDKDIALQEEKLNKTKNLKKAMLEKMFPKAGSKQPEVRFDGFSGNWEEKELGEQVEFFSGLTYSPSNIVANGGTLVLRSSNVQNSEIYLNDNVYVDTEVVSSQNVELGDIIVVVRNGSRALIGKHAIIKTIMKDTVIGAFMTGIRYEYSYFVNALLDTQQFTIEINKSLGATINQITLGNFRKMLFFFPDEKEQEKIGNYFKELDKAIALQSEQLEKLKNIKKAYLAKMFV